MAFIATFNFQFLTVTSFAQFTKLLDFQGAESHPNGSLISDGTFLYGMTRDGGTSNIGTIFKIKLDGTSLSKLFDFDSLNGSHPRGSLISDGTFLYGVTNWGGTGTCQKGCGVIFKIKPDGTGYSKLFDFSDSSGFHPQGSLIFDGTFLYGMTVQGGTNNQGVIFKIKPDGTGYAKLLDFMGTTNGGWPYGSLISAGSFLYGMTHFGGTSGNGVVFKIKSDGTGFVKLFDFDPLGSSTGSKPYGSLFSDGTFLYGLTVSGGLGTCPSGGCGKIFKIKLDGTAYEDLRDFAGTPDGGSPHGSLISDGLFLYGMTKDGGTNDAGIIFKIKPDGTGYSKLIDFNDTRGNYPYGSLVSDGSFLYGMASWGGASFNNCQDGCGTIFKYSLVTDIAENNKSIDFSVYPNPNNGTFAVETKEIDYTINVTNILGENIYHSEIKNWKTEIDLSKHPNGIYFLNIKTKQGTISKKLIINR